MSRSSSHPGGESSPPGPVHADLYRLLADLTARVTRLEAEQRARDLDRVAAALRELRRDVRGIRP